MSLKGGNIIAASLLCVLILAAGLQRNGVRKVQAENDVMRVRAQSPITPRVDSRVPASHEIEKFREATRDLPRLRNEVRQLRAQKREVETLRADNERLFAQLGTNQQPAARSAPTVEQGFILNNSWAYTGFAAPEALIQTFFWAARQQDAQTVMACFTLQAAQEFGFINGKTGELREEALRHMLDTFGKLQAYRIIRAEEPESGTMKLGLQAAVDGQAITLSLRRIGQDWKISGF